MNKGAGPGTNQHPNNYMTDIIQDQNILFG